MQEHVLLPTFQKKDSGSSFDSASLIDVDSSEEGGKPEKGKKKSRGLRVCGLRVGIRRLGGRNVDTYMRTYVHTYTCMPCSSSVLSAV